VNGDGFDDIAVVDSESGGGVYLLFLGNYGQLLSFVKAPSSGGAFVALKRRSPHSVTVTRCRCGAVSVVVCPS
jgi:hypothetical protein